MLYLIALLVSACSMAYELLLAQAISATMGATFLRYNLTIGIYLASLGFGALICFRRGRTRLVEKLVAVELGLAWLGMLSPLMVYAWDAGVFRLSAATGLPFRGAVYQALLHVFNNSLIVAIGMLSGFELPLLMSLAGKRSNEVLAVDYFGTLVGTIAFPLFLLPELGVVESSVLAGGLNSVVALALVLSVPAASRWRMRLSALTLAAAVSLWFSSGAIHAFIFENFFLF